MIKYEELRRKACEAIKTALPVDQELVEKDYDKLIHTADKYILVFMVPKTGGEDSKILISLFSKDHKELGTERMKILDITPEEIKTKLSKFIAEFIK